MALESVKFILAEPGPEKFVIVFPGGGMSIQPGEPGIAYVTGPGFSHRVKLNEGELSTLRADKTLMDIRAEEQAARLPDGAGVPLPADP